MKFQVRNAIHTPFRCALALAAFSLQACSAPKPTDVPDPVTPAAVTSVSASTFVGPVGTALTSLPSVKVTASDGAAVQGVAVTFIVVAGGGSLTQANATTNASGVATVGSWTLGTVVGTNTVTATVSSLTPVTFFATAVAGPASKVAIVSGNNQTATVGAAVAVAPSVKVTDRYGNAVSGATVTFAIASGGGNVTAGVQTTDASGIATLGSWILGTVAGANSISATVSSLTPVNFNATALVGPASNLTVLAGNNQSTVAGTAVPILPSVKLTDAYGNAIAGATVTFAIASGGGGLTGGSQVTSAAGIASLASWTLGIVAGVNTITVSAPGIAPVTITATGSIAVVLEPLITAVAPLSVVAFTAKDQSGATLPVTWRVNGVAGGTAQSGFISAGGQYTAPAIIPTGDSVVVTATANSDATAQGAGTAFFVPDLTTKGYFVALPRVFDATQPMPTRLLLVPPTGTASVTLVPPTGSQIPMTAIGNGVHSVVISPTAALAGYRTSSLHNFAGYLDYRDGAGVVSRFNLFVNVRDATMPNVTITQLAADAQRSPFVLNLRVDQVTSSPTSTVVSRALQLLGGDQFDFVSVVATVSTFSNRFYAGVRNDITGIGAAVFNNSAAWGGTGKLRGAINFPIDTYFDGAEGGMIHEVGHSWINHGTAPLLATGVPHWPASTMAQKVMGMSIAGSNVGGQFPWMLTSLGNGTVRLNTVPPSDLFSPLDLYLLGLVTPAEVPPMYVLPVNADPSTFVEGMISPATTYTIAEYIAHHGARTPGSAVAQKAFTMAVVVLTYGRFLTQAEMAFFDVASSRAETTVPVKSMAGFATGDASGFFLATGGRATLRTRLP